MASSTLLSAAPTFTPAQPPPPGVLSNPDHPQTLKGVSDIAISVCLILTTIFFSARCYCRYWIKNTFIFEDVLATIAWAGTVANCALVAVTMRRHGGEHVWDITSAELHQAAFWFNVVSIEYGIMIGMTKITILMLYRRVFITHRYSWFDIATRALIIVLVLFYGITTCFKIWECKPRAKIFNMALPGKCFNVGTILKTSGAFNTVTDFLILLLPVQAVQKLQMTKQKKLLVVLVFTFGLCAPIFATIGFVVRLQESSNRDTSWGQPDILLWGLAELASGNLCISFPEMSSLFRSRTRGSTRGTPRRPTASELHPYKEASALSYIRRKKLRSDPYMMSTLVGTTATNNFDDSPYTEIDEAKYGAQAGVTEKRENGHQLKEGTIMINSEFSVRSHDAV